jgi:hypothetical protein
MKQLIFYLLLCGTICNQNANAQLTVQESAPTVTVGKTALGELYYKIIDNDTMYTLLFRNAEYSTLIDYCSVTWQSEMGETQNLYDIIMSVFKDENKKNKEYKIQFKLGSTDVIVSTSRVMGMTQAWFWTNDGYTAFTQEQVKRLFGKDKK